MLTMILRNYQYKITLTLIKKVIRKEAKFILIIQLLIVNMVSAVWLLFLPIQSVNKVILTTVILHLVTLQRISILFLMRMILSNSKMKLMLIRKINNRKIQLQISNNLNKFKAKLIMKPLLIMIKIKSYVREYIKSLKESKMT